MSATDPLVRKLVEASVNDDGLSVRFGDADAVIVPWLWVRDHSEDPASLNHETMQRSVDTFGLSADLVGSSVVVADGKVIVEWADGSPPSELSIELLQGVLAPEPLRRPTRWEAGSKPAVATVANADDVLSADPAVARRALCTWLDAVANDGFGVVSGLAQTTEAAAELAERIGPPRSSIFGAMWSLSSDLNDHHDTAYSTTYLEPHTDGTYSHESPGLQMFACIERDGTGGESILVDGFAAAGRLRARDPAAFEMLTTVSVPGRYIEAGVHLRSERPTIGLAADGTVQRVSFNNYDRAPFLLPGEQMLRWYEAYSAFHAEIVDRDHWVFVPLQPGDVLLLDNWRVLHGRMAYTGRRVFEGCYHNHEDFESKLRVLGR